ncbi:glycosyl hydrolase 108 family protein [Accumulibacter sp.]|jgi:lysozyme family protein|uniref:glycoside hydrolase family 108 protein n=1 Tax=Accumulibacter sp. TaxID=2053492 RepID=UPI002B58E0A0|nr:glycosyl hydrolase 108 family protein [Accumulibacter sp.]HPU79674.1 glycosyl hydrolase 108 family protein [Accumulibacter sp.]
MLPLVPLALSIVPELIKMIAGDKAGDVATTVANVVQEVTGTPDAAEAQRKLASDPALASQLRIRLAEIALETQKAMDSAAEQKRQAELAAQQKALENTQGARSTMVDLVKSGSSIAWGAPVVSVIVTVGFFGILLVLILSDKAFPAELTSIINITVGALAAAFATVVNFWLGSSQGSRDKDSTARDLQTATLNLQATHAAATERMVQTLAAAASPAVPAAKPASSGDANFESCLAIVVDKEGGFSDHPRDRGGPTNLGITLRTLASWQGLNFEEITEEAKAKLLADLKALTKREAAEIYRANYWLPMRCGDLPRGVDLMLFDFGVNAGPRTSVKLMQRAVGVTADGSLGPQTLAAATATDAGKLIDALAEARLAYYRSLDNFDVFGAGWSKRTSEVAALAHSMTT